MSNIIDYLDWRGDLSFDVSPFNEVDNLLCAYLSYVPLDDILGKKDEKTLREISEAFWETHNEKDILDSNSVVKYAPIVMKKMAESSRFAEVTVSDYVAHYNAETGKQFGALVIHIDPELHYISFRGTDDRILGWYEDLCMSFKVVPSQREARLYLASQAGKHSGRLMVGGHSKGGNLAIYAATFVGEMVQDRLDTIFINDGPGFLDGVLEEERFDRVKDKVKAFVPKSCVVGLLLEDKWEMTIVENKKNGIAQHDMYTWEVCGDHMVYAEGLTKDSDVMRVSMDNWLYGMTAEQRESATEDLFATLKEANFQSITDLGEGGLRKIWNIIDSMHNHKEGRDALKAMVKAILGEKVHMTLHRNPKKEPET